MASDGWSAGDPSGRPTVLVVVGGDREVVARVPGQVPPGTLVVAADSGLDVAHAAGLRVDHVVGDFDSVDPATLERAAADGVEVHRHPADKAATDLELAVELGTGLALRHAAGTGAAGPEPKGPAAGTSVHGTLLVVGSGGGRLDHELGNLFLLASPRLERWEVRARFGAASIAVVRPGSPAVLTGLPGEQVSLLPVHGDARGVTTAGLRWSLSGADLRSGTSRGVSNELVAAEASVSLVAGVLLAVRPGTSGDRTRPTGR